MKMRNELRAKLDEAFERLAMKRAKLHKEGHTSLGATCAPRPAGYVEDDPTIKELDYEWVNRIEPENGVLDGVIREVLAEAPKVDASKLAKLTPDKVWVWGGQTPSWGGSMQDDTLVRGADYFNAENVVYVYGPTTDKMMSIHSKYKKMLCQINANCRTDGALAGTEEENAELLSKLSLKYPNIVGAMCDDFSTGFSRVLLPERFAPVYKALKKHNDKLKLYGVVYTHELVPRKFDRIQPYIDVVNLWFWFKDEILEFDERLERCRSMFPGKPIILGIFLHEYGAADAGNPPEILCHQLEKARERLTAGEIEGIIILGDREIKKWPESAKAVKDYLRNQ